MIKECNFKYDELCLLKNHMYINPRDISLKGFNGRCTGEENCILYRTYKKLHENTLDDFIKELKKREYTIEKGIKGNKDERI